MAIALYSFVWIPTIGFIIYFLIKKDTNGTKKRNLIISFIVLISSFIIFVFIAMSNSLTDVHVSLEKTTYDIHETAEVKITTTPSESAINSLELNNNDIAKLDYSDGKATLTFIDQGKVTLTFIANENIKSNSITLNIIDEEAIKKAEEEAKKKVEEEAKRKAEEEAAKKAEEERIAAEQAAKKKAEEEARIAAEQQAAEEARIAQEQQSQQQVGSMVWLSATGEKYHRIPNCGRMNPDKARQVSLSDAQSSGYEACQKCY